MSTTEKKSFPLNKPQKKAVTHHEGPLLILAGAGAGKTRVITERIVHLMENGVQGGSILAITFTNKAAAEMRERIGKSLGRELSASRLHFDTSVPFVSTFHALGLHIIKEHTALAELENNFAILDRNDCIRSIKKSMVKADFDPKTYEPKKILGAISKAKGQGLTQEKYAASTGANYWAQIVAKVWKNYKEDLKTNNAVDFDDLLLKTKELLEHNEVVRKHYQKRWSHIHIDEYQDTNGVQYDLAKLLVSEKQNICVVGDADQNIYSWRGAEIKHILHFEKDFPNTTTVLLEENYRSTQTIIAAANEIIKKNNFRQEKNLFTNNTPGEPIEVISTYDGEHEATTVAERVAGLVASGVPPQEIAILYRANFQSRNLEEGFLQAGLPYQLLGTKFYDRQEIRDTLSYIKAALNPASEYDLTRIINTPRRGIGKVTLDKLFSGQKDTLSPSAQKKVDDVMNLLEKLRNFIESNHPSEAIKFVAKQSGLEAYYKAQGEEGLERLENIRELVTIAKRYDAMETPGSDHTMNLFLEDTALLGDQDSMNTQAATRLMTVHAAKGLEFDHVFIVGLEQDLFPHKRLGESKLSAEQSEEERRLFYVALTRARSQVYLLHASTRMVFGSRQYNTSSEFIDDIPENLLLREESSTSNDSDDGWTRKVVYLDDF